MRRPGRSLVALSVAVVLLAALVPGMAAMMVAIVEPAWIFVALVMVAVEPAPELTHVPSCAPVFAPSGLRAPPAPLA